MTLGLVTLTHTAAVLLHAVLLDADDWLRNVHQDVITCVGGRKVVVCGRSLQHSKVWWPECVCSATHMATNL